MSQTTRNATRERVEALLEREIQGELDEDSREWLEAHRDEYPEYADALGALEGRGELWDDLDVIPMKTPPLPLEVKEQVRAHLLGEPVEALPMEGRPRLGVIALVLLAVGLLLAGLGVRADFQDQPWYRLVLPAMLLIGGFVVAMISFDHLRQRGYFGLSIGVMVGGPVLFVGVALLMGSGPHSHAMTGFWGPALGCGSVGLVVGLAVLVPAIVLARRGMAGPSKAGALLLGITAASVGVGALHLRCPMVDISHVLVGHGVLFVLVPVAALLLRSMRRLA